MPATDERIAMPQDPLSTPPPGGVFAGYAPEHHPLGSYAVLTGAFGTAFGGGLAALVASGHELPERPRARDVALFALATQKVTRLIAKDRVTSFLRAPFVRYEEDSGRGEVSEEPRGTGMRRAIGELVNCPYCLAQWVLGAFTLGLVGAPRVTRLLAGMYAAEALSDALQLAYSAADERT